MDTTVSTIAQTSRQMLRNYVERLERLDEEKRALTADMGDVLKEAESKGFDKKAIRAVLKLRRLDKKTRETQTEVVETYMCELENA